MAQNRFDLELGLDFSKVTEALQQIKSQFTGTSAEFQKIANKFKDSFNTMTNAIKLYGKDSSQAQAATKSMERAMVELTKNGIDPASVGFKQLQSQIGPLASKMDKTGNTVKKSNMQWTNFALILQDLPYGFRGIQNNLPAVIGGLAGMTGPIYLIGSALIALFTAYDMGAFGATKSTNDWKKALKETNDEIRNTINYTNSEVSNLQGLVDVMLDLNTTESIRNKALAEAREAITKVDEAQGKKIKTIGDAIIAINLYSEAIQQQQMQEVIGKKIAEISIGQIEKRNKLAIETAKANKGIHPIDFFMGNTELDNLNSEIIANETLLRQLEDLRKGNTKALLLNPYSDLNRKGGKDTKGPKPKETYLLESLKAQQQAYKDDIYAFRAYGILIINEEERLAVERAKTDGTYLQNKKDIHARYQADRLTNNNLFEQNLNKVLDDNAKIRTAQEKKELELQAANRLDIAHAILAINKKFAEDDLRNAILFAKNQTNIIETELAVQDKLNRNSLTERIEYTKQALAKLAVLAAYTFDPKVLAVYLDSFDKVNAKLKGMGTTWEATSLKIKGLIEGVMSDSISQFAENIGKSFNGEDVDIFGGITEIIATGLQNIGKALIAYGTAMDAFKLAFTNPFAAIAAGVVLVATGAALQGSVKKMNDSGTKTKKFANGGIISGPTMGLMGEYPGARTNPEVVAPLDKLKDMIGGGGGGTFMLRGQDLLLSVNRAQKASNLKGQNISLA
jgi:hypothetical protein